ncbi:hypothetical protein ACFQZC_17815 [Streptacidiphilus monticola]
MGAAARASGRRAVRPRPPPRRHHGPGLGAGGRLHGPRRRRRAGRALLAPALRPGRDGTDAEAALAAWLEAAAREGRSIRHVARRAARPDAPEPVRAALACLEELHVLKSCLPSGSPQDDGLDLDDVVAGRRPLYLFGAASEARVRAADHSTMPLLTALLDELLTRLPPKATLVLDDIAAVAPAPGLPGSSTGARTSPPC